MAKEFQPLLMEDLKIQISGCRVRRLVLNRHMPRVDQVKVHQHPYHQWLLYLRGAGVQLVGSEKYPVRRGTLISLGQKQEHGFWKERNISPLCLAIDFDFPDSPTYQTQTLLSGDALSEVERGIHQLTSDAGHDSEIVIAAGVLNLVSILEKELSGQSRSPSGRYFNQVRQTIKNWTDWSDRRPAGVAEQLGVSIDYLNRQLQREARTTVGRVLAQERFELTCHLLESTDLDVGTIAERVGIVDQNYFARWFRKHAGISPSQWRQVPIIV